MFRHRRFGRKGVEVKNSILFQSYKGNTYHPIENERGELYLCGCSKVTGLMLRMGLNPIGYRRTHHTHIRNSQMEIELRFGI